MSAAITCCTGIPSMISKQMTEINSFPIENNPVKRNLPTLKLRQDATGRIFRMADFLGNVKLIAEYFCA